MISLRRARPRYPNVFQPVSCPALIPNAPNLVSSTAVGHPPQRSRQTSDYAPQRLHIEDRGTRNPKRYGRIQKLTDARFRIDVSIHDVASPLFRTLQTQQAPRQWPLASRRKLAATEGRRANCKSRCMKHSSTGNAFVFFQGSRCRW
jgi:hypothetical protein